VDQADDAVTNQRTGERVEFVTETPELLVMRVTWPRSGQRAAEHIHPNMDETWTIVSGHASFLVDGVQIHGAAGTKVTAPAGRRHLAWNSGDGPAELAIEMRPALRWAEFVRRFFAGGDPVALLAEFSDEIILPG
jgi:quercetin dioxygenase-like cupin family protein